MRFFADWNSFIAAYPEYLLRVDDSIDFERARREPTDDRAHETELRIPILETAALESPLMRRLRLRVVAVAVVVAVLAEVGAWAQSTPGTSTARELQAALKLP